MNLLDSYNCGNFNLNIMFKNKDDVDKNEPYYYFCRELLISDHNYDPQNNGLFYILPTYSLNSHLLFEDNFDEFNNAFYKINYKKFDNYIKKDCFLPNLEIISEFKFKTPQKPSELYKTINPDLNIVNNTDDNELINAGYALQPYNCPVDSWNLLVIRSYMLAAFYTEINKEEQEQFTNDSFKYMCQKFDYYLESYEAIQVYNEEIFGNEDQYKHINAYSGILEFMDNKK